MSEIDVREPRAPRRGLGPFTGAQLTVIIVVFALVLLAPIGAWAVSGSNVFITDPGSGQRAFVSGAGQVNVTASGAKAFYTHFTQLALVAGMSKAATPPNGRALVITSIVVDTYKDATPGASNNTEFFMSTADASCAHVNVSFPVVDTNPGALGDTVLPFNPGLVVPGGRSLCVQNFSPSNLYAEVYVYGYTIPASAAPAGASGRSTAPPEPQPDGR
jgi:hypothetical protein